MIVDFGRFFAIMGSMSDNGKRLEIIDGRECVVHPSGLIQDATTGYIVKPAPRTLITEDNSTAYHRARRERAIEAAERGILAGLPDDVIAADVFGGMEVVIAAQTRLALDTKKGRASTEAAKMILAAAELLPQRTAAPSGDSGDSATITIPAAFAARLVALVAATGVSESGESNDV